MRRNYIDLDGIKLSLKAQIDAEAAELRSRFLSQGMESVYADKRLEAEAFLADQSLTESETPYLTVEANVFNDTRYNVAVSIIISSYQWGLVSSKIEQLRLTHKNLVDLSSNLEEARNHSVVDWSEVSSYL